MNNNHHLITTAILASCMSATTSFAQNCAVPPTCEDLGYTQTANECVGMKSIKCPLDLTKMICHPYPLQIGDILYGNGKTSPEYNSKIGSPIGVVFDINGRKAISLSSNYTSTWAPQKLLTQKTDDTSLTNFKDFSNGASQDFDGYSNTVIIKNAYGILEGPAYLCNYSLYQPAFLLSLGEYDTLYKNFDKINKAFQKAGKTFYRKELWTSTEGSDATTWVDESISMRQAWYFYVNKAASSDIAYNKSGLSSKSSNYSSYCGYLF